MYLPLEWIFAIVTALVVGLPLGVYLGRLRARLTQQTRDFEAAAMVMQAHAMHATPASKRALPVIQATPTCSNCVNFDVELGQREMKKNPSFIAATQTVEPWRMGRVLKQTPEGELLPFEQQGLDPRLLTLTWADAGACKVHREIRFGPQDACPQHEVLPS